MKQLLLIFLISALPIVAFGQIITGQLLSDETNDPLPTATIISNNYESGTVTDDQGRFQLDINGGENIILSSMYFKNYEIKNIPTTLDTIHLGKISLINAGIIMYETVDK